MRRITLTSLVLALGVVLALAPLVLAQQPPPAWKQGQSPELADSPLAPVPLPPTPTPAKDIPVDKIKLPPGFTISVRADGLHNARQMAWGTRGTLFVGTRVAGSVYAVVDRGDRREFPKDAHHNWRFLLWGPDGKLYFNMGAPCNICMPPDTHANISRVNPDGTGFEYYARGVRNSTGADFHPVTKELYFVSHGRDWMGDEIPNDTLHHAPRPGFHFGYPYCHQGDIVDPDFGRGRSCSEFAPPLLKLGPHVAPIGFRFYTGSLFPPQYRNVAFSAQKGSWNRTVKIGYRVMTVELKPGQPPKYEVFADGFHQGDKVLGRPTHIEWMPDGSMLLSDDYHGAIYHITYKR